MFAKFKGAIANAVSNIEGTVVGQPIGHGQPAQDRGPPLKFRYTRPAFLQLNTDDEILVSADHGIRPIIVPRDMSKLPWNAGYAECINAGKSSRNEDQAAMHRGLLRAVVAPESMAQKVADMLPMVPSYPRQTPINPGKPIPTPFDPVRTEPSGSEAAAGDDSTKVALNRMLSNGSNHSGGLTDSADEELRTDNGQQKQQQPASTAAESSSGTTPESNDGAPNQSSPAINEAPLNPTDLLSPSVPLPINELTLSDIKEDPPQSPTTSTTSASRTSAIVEESLPWIYFGMFDGHAGSGVAVAAANTLHKIIQDKLQNIADLLIEFGLKEVGEEPNDSYNPNEQPTINDEFNIANCNRQRTLNGSVIINHDKHVSQGHERPLFQPAPDKLVTVDSLIIGALEAAFWEMDREIAADKRLYRMNGGCTALAAVFILGKLYVANAGDSRCIMYKNQLVEPLSFDFTPESERERVKYLGLLKPDLLGSDFTHVEFVKRPTRRDLGKKLLYRDAYMTGWSYKTVTIDDLRFPLVYGEGKRSRVLATIGVTRGFGDHELKAQNSNVDIKPFLTPQPEVRIVDLEKETDLTDSDVIILGTDGLWDVTSNEKVCDVVQKALDHFPANDQQRFKYRYISAAQDLVMTSRGKSKEKGRGWKTGDNKIATIDDISVFVIPLKPYRQEYLKWKEARSLVKQTTDK